MKATRTSARIPALALLVLGTACRGIDLEESDEDALFLEARVRKDLGETKQGRGPHLELGWSSVHDDADTLDYAIDAATLGAGMDVSLPGQTWIGVVAGLAWQSVDLETSAGELHDQDGWGLYAGVEAGWQATAWLEPYARLDSASLFDELATTARLEAGVRLHVLEHAALLIGWRSVDYEIDDITSGLVFNSVELDSKGLVVGFQLSF